MNSGAPVLPLPETGLFSPIDTAYRALQLNWG
jgi:hypothetical protein